MRLRKKIDEIKWRVRGWLPGWLRKLYRIARTLETVKTSKSLPQELISECRFIASRVEMLDRLPQGGIIAELGTYEGKFAKKILNRNSPRELHVIDLDYSHFDHSLESDQRLKIHQGFNHEVISAFPDNYFDWIYIDGGHDYDSVMEDALSSASKVKPGGYLVFNDFAHIDPYIGRYGVHRAVVDFVLEKRWLFHFFAFERNALYDVALKKPLT